jgi:hypothetical protein
MFRLTELVARQIQTRLTLSYFLPLLTLALITTWFGLFWSVARFAELTGGLSFMDMQPTLTVSALFVQIASYDKVATDFYLLWSLFDYLWPLITFTTMLFISAWLLRFLTATWQRLLPWLVASAYLTVLMDWLENVGFAWLVLVRPAEPLWLAQVTLALHIAKLFFNMVFNLGFWTMLVAITALSARALWAKH